MVQAVPEKRRTLSVEEAAAALGIGRRLAYELARSGELPGVRRLRSKYVVSKDALDRYLAAEGEDSRQRL
jgi:excisionase family DNA binding protein